MTPRPPDARYGWSRRLSNMLWLCAALLCSPAMAQDDPPGRVGRIAALQGEVWVYEAEQGAWAAAPLNRPVTSGDRLSTAPAAAATLQVGSTVLYLAGSSELEVLQLDDEALRFRLEQGSLALRVRSQEAAAELVVANFEGRFAPLTPGLYRIDRLDERSDAAVWRGEMQFEAPDLRVVLQAGQRVRFWQDGQPLATLSIALAPLDDDFAQAVQRQDQVDPRNASAQFVPPEMTGSEDLDRHGSWQQHPEYGAVWSPTVVSVGWAPYRHGQWVWLRPWGWTWVDDAPWGFAPFHYGRWFWWGSRWRWAPGPWVRRPVYAPALVAWTGAPPPGHRVGAPVVGWVPLAPREIYRPAYRASPGHVNRVNPYAPLLQPPPPGYGNRGVPGAVTLLPAPALKPRQPVADAALRIDPRAAQPAWRDEQFRHQAPARPAWTVREQSAPRPTSPVGNRPSPWVGGDRHSVPGVPRAAQPGTATGPFFGQPTQRRAPPDGVQAAPAAAPPVAAMPAVPAPTAVENAPRRPPRAPPTQATRQEGPQPSRDPARGAAPALVPTAPTAPGAVAAPAAPMSPAAPGRPSAVPNPFKPAPDLPAAAPIGRPDPTQGKDGRDPGERRRTPDSRQRQIER